MKDQDIELLARLQRLPMGVTQDAAYRLRGILKALDSIVAFYEQFDQYDALVADLYALIEDDWITET
jgi:hypothetical protein